MLNHCTPEAGVLQQQWHVLDVEVVQLIDYVTYIGYIER